MQAAWAGMSLAGMAATCPLRTMARIPSPAIVRRAGWKLLNPSPAADYRKARTQAFQIRTEVASAPLAE